MISQLSPKFFFSKVKLTHGPAYDSVVLTFVKIVTVLCGIIVTKLLSKYFTLIQYGTYSQAMLIVTTASSLSIFGLTNAVNYFYNSSYSTQEKEHYISTIFVIEYVLGILLSITILACSRSIVQYFSNEQLQSVIYVVAFMPLFLNLLPMLQVLFVSIGKAKLIALRNFLLSLARLLTVIFACLITKNIMTVFIVILILDILQVIYFMICFSRIKFSISVSKFKVSLVKPIVFFCVPMAVYVLTNGLSRDIDKYIIGFFTNTSTLAIYSNAAKALPFDLLTSSFIVVLVPLVTRHVSAHNYEQAYQAFKAYLRLGYITTWIFAFGAVINAKEMMLFLYDSKYLPGLSVFIVYLFVDMLIFASSSIILTARGKTKTLMLFSVTKLIINLIVSFTAFKLLGIIGPALSTFTVTLAYIICILSVSAKEIEKSFFDLFSWSEMFVVIIGILVTSSICIIIKKYVYYHTDSYLIALFISYFTFTFLLMLINRKKIVSCLTDINKYR